MKNLLSQIGTLVTVTVIAVLVWLYAEDANVQAYTAQPVRVQFVLPDGAEGLLSPSEPITVLVDFDGSNGQFQQFDDANNEPVEIELPIDQTQDLQAMEIDLAEEIEQANRFKQLGINVTSVSPERANVSFEKILAVPLDVKIRQRTGTVKLASAGFVDPSKPPRVVIEMPASTAQLLSGSVASAWIDEDDVTSLEKGSPQQITVELEVPGLVTTLPRNISTVDLLVTVADDRDTVQIERRPILLSYPPSINERYIVEIEESDRFITAFTLEGPRDQIAQLKEDPTSKDVWASVRLSNEEADAAVADGGVLSKTVDIIAPRGVVLTSDIVRVSIKVVPRETPAAP